MAARSYSTLMYRNGVRVSHAAYPVNVEISKRVNDIYYCSLTYLVHRARQVTGWLQNTPEYWDKNWRAEGLNFYAIDNIVQVYRYPEQRNSNSHNVFTGVILQREEFEDVTGEYVKLGIYGMNELLMRRAVDYQCTASGTVGYTIKTDYADDMIKAVAYDNMGGGAAAARQMPNFSIAPDASNGPSITYEFPHENVFTVCQEIAEIADNQGTAVYFDVVMNNASSFELRTYINQMGADTSGRTMFADWLHNIERPLLAEDYSREVNYVGAYGAGSKGAQDYQYSQDANRIGRSIWGMRELVLDPGNMDTTALASLTEAELRNGRPRLEFSCNLLDQDNSIFGIDWNFGYKVKVAFNGRSYKGLVSGLDIDWAKDRGEKLVGHFEYETAIGSGEVVA